MVSTFCKPAIRRGHKLDEMLRVYCRGVELLAEGGAGALMRINLWIILAALLALLAITRYLQDQQDTEHICADDPTASVCQR